MMSRWFVVAMLLSCATFADETGLPIVKEQPLTLLDKAELEHWIKDSTAAASPRFGVVTVIDKERGVFVIAEKITIAVKEHRTVVILGDERREQPVVKLLIATTQTRYPLEENSLYDIDGKRLKKEESLKRLKVGLAVVLSSDGKMVDPRYRRAMHADTLILIPPVVEPLHEHELEKP